MSNPNVASGAVGRINVRDVHIAFIIRDDRGGAEFEPPTLIPGAMQVQLTPRAANSTIHGDGVSRYRVVRVDGYDVAFDHNRIPAQILARMKGQQYDGDGKVRNTHAGDVPADFAMGWTVDLTGGDVEVTWLPKCSMTPPSRNVQQSTDSINHSPDSITIFSMPLEYNRYYEHIADTSDTESGFTKADAAVFFDEVPVLPPRGGAEVNGLSAPLSSPIPAGADILDLPTVPVELGTPVEVGATSKKK